MYVVSLKNDGYFRSVSLISTPNALSKPGSPVSPATGSLMNKVTGSFDSTVGSPVTSLYITDYTTDFNLLSEPLIPLLEVMLLQPAPVPVRPSHAPDLQVDPSPAVFSREGPFDAFTEPADTSDHPLISLGLTGCPYRMTTYREEDIAQMDAAFGMQLHHPGFLECIGASESARLLGRPPAEWLQVMDRQDVLVAAMQLQRDATLMASNITVLSQYVTSLHQMSTEVMQSVFGREYFPSQSIDDAALVPRVNRSFTQMAAMGLWRPPINPGGPGLITAHHDVDCTGCTECPPQVSH